MLIALFGVVPESPHGLDELVELYIRPRFVICFSVFAFIVLVVVLVVSSFELFLLLF